jgi:hypothetical protein
LPGDHILASSVRGLGCVRHCRVGEAAASLGDNRNFKELALKEINNLGDKFLVQMKLEGSKMLDAEQRLNGVQPRRQSGTSAFLN